MKYAVIETGGKQYLAREGQELMIDLLEAKSDNKLSFAPLLVIDDQTTHVGTPTVSGFKVSAEVVEPLHKGEKLLIRKYKPKKRISKTTGHRQKHTLIKITAIAK